MNAKLLGLLKNRFVIVATLLAVSLGILLFSFPIPKTAQFINPAGQTQQAHFPHFPQSGELGKYTVNLTIPGGWLRQTRFRLVPDDEVVAITVNKKPVDLTHIAPEARRDFMKGFDIDLGRYLKSGPNRVSVDFNNFGGRVGLDVQPSSRDRTFQVLLAVASTALLSLVYLVLRRRRQDGSEMDRLTAIATLFVLMLGFAVRFYMANEGTVDLRDFVAWQNHVRTQGGLSALKEKFTVYPVLFEYLLYLGSLMPVTALHAFKIIYVGFELLGSVLAALLVHRRYPAQPAFSWLAFVAVYLGPTVLLNGQFWGQCDMIFSSMLVGCLYLALRGKNVLSLGLFGVAFAFKMQSLFLAPFFLILLVRREIRFWHLFATPTAYLLVHVPAILLGKSWTVIYEVYFAQTKFFPWLSAGLPNVYQWIPDARPELFAPLGIMATTTATLALAMLAYHSREPRSDGILVQAATVSSILVPFLLPHMHERYFLFADVMTVIFAFYYPRYYFVPVVVGFLSFLCYGPFMLGFPLPIPMPYMAVGMLAMLVTVLRKFVITLYPNAVGTEAASPKPSTLA